MADDDNSGRDMPSLLSIAGGGTLRIALLFGMAAVAFALIIVPIADRHSRSAVAAADGGIDLMSTGSIAKQSYTVRRSVLQPNPQAVCIIRPDGTRTGSC